jgi:hypothetical protein
MLAGQTKEKLLYILDILKKTDEQHPVNTVEILRKLENKGLVAERKSIARDISVLREAGYSIISCDELKKGFYMTDQPFEDYELKMLADAIAGAKFLTEQDTENLLEKLTQLATPTGRRFSKNRPSSIRRSRPTTGRCVTISTKSSLRSNSAAAFCFAIMSGRRRGASNSKETVISTRFRRIIWSGRRTNII